MTPHDPASAGGSTGELAFTREEKHPDVPPEGGIETFIEWTLSGPAGVIAWAVGKCTHDDHPWHATPIAYHSRRPVFEDQSTSEDKCPWFEDDTPCYADISFELGNQMLLQWLTASRDDRVIERQLSRRYTEWLCSDKDVHINPLTMFSESIKRAAGKALVDEANDFLAGP